MADDDTQSGSDTEPVLVKNVAPTVSLNAVPMIDEHGTATLAGTYTDIGLLDGHTLSVDWDDPNNATDSTFTIPALRDAAGVATLNVGDMFSSSTDSAVLTITSINGLTGQVGFTVQHQYLDDGLAPGNNTASDTSTIGVTVLDDDTQSGSDTEPVLVKNVAPTVSLNVVPDDQRARHGHAHRHVHGYRPVGRPHAHGRLGRPQQRHRLDVHNPGPARRGRRGHPQRGRHVQFVHRLGRADNHVDQRPDRPGRLHGPAPVPG